VFWQDPQEYKLNVIDGTKPLYHVPGLLSILPKKTPATLHAISRNRIGTPSFFMDSQGEISPPYMISGEFSKFSTNQASSQLNPRALLSDIADLGNLCELLDKEKPTPLRQALKKKQKKPPKRKLGDSIIQDHQFLNADVIDLGILSVPMFVSAVDGKTTVMVTCSPPQADPVADDSETPLSVLRLAFTADFLNTLINNRMCKTARGLEWMPVDHHQLLLTTMAIAAEQEPEEADATEEQES